MEEDHWPLNILAEGVEELTTKAVQRVIDGSDEMLVFCFGYPSNQRAIEPRDVRRIHTRDAETTARLIVERLRAWNRRRQRVYMDHSHRRKQNDDLFYQEMEEADKELMNWLYGPTGG